MKKWFNSTEEAVSMFLGLVIVLVVVGLIINYFNKKQQGNVEVPGITNTKIAEDLKVTLTGVPEEKKAEPAQNEMVVYEVKKGDSLWKIAEKNLGSGYKWTEIAKVNRLKNPGRLSTGQKLNLTIAVVSSPKPEVDTRITAPNTITGNNYTVMKGDSLWKIAVRAYGDGYRWTAIWRANKKLIADPSKLYSGNNLIIPRDGKGP